MGVTNTETLIWLLKMQNTNFNKLSYKSMLLCDDAHLILKKLYSLNFQFFNVITKFAYRSNPNHHYAFDFNKTKCLEKKEIVSICHYTLAFKDIIIRELSQNNEIFFAKIVPHLVLGHITIADWLQIFLSKEAELLTILKSHIKLHDLIYQKYNLTMPFA